MKQGTKPPSLPEKAPHFFVRVAFDFVPEISYEDIVLLSQLAEKTGSTKKYRALADSLIKIQWAKFAGLEAIVVEKRISGQASENVVPFDAIGQAQHSKALFDFVSHAKASLDSLAVFLNTLLNLGCKGGDCDFRKLAFRRKVCAADSVIGDYMKALETWLEKDRDNSDSIIATRDQWLHRDSPPVSAMFPPQAIGYLPIPRSLKIGFPNDDTPLTSEHYWTTPEFVEFHFKKLTGLFGALVKGCVSLEQAHASTPVQPDLSDLHPISFFPMKGTKDTTIRQFRVHIWNPVPFDANTILEELPHKILRALSNKEAELFAKLAENRTFLAKDQEHPFVLLSDDFLKTTLGMSRDDIDQLAEVGLVTNRQVRLDKACILICGHRGWRVSWPDDQQRTVPAISLTRLGSELASLVPLQCHDAYVDNVIHILNASKINVRLMAISDSQGGHFRFDDLGYYEFR